MYSKIAERRSARVGQPVDGAGSVVRCRGQLRVEFGETDEGRPTGEGWLYLAAVQDFFSCRIVGARRGPGVV